MYVFQGLTKMVVVLKKRPILLLMGIGELLGGMVVLCIKLGDFRGVVLSNLC